MLVRHFLFSLYSLIYLFFISVHVHVIEKKIIKYDQKPLIKT